jgi:hypothetical protein
VAKSATIVCGSRMYPLSLFQRLQDHIFSRRGSETGNLTASSVDAFLGVWTLLNVRQKGSKIQNEADRPPSPSR